MISVERNRLYIRGAVTIESVPKLLPEVLAACRAGARVVDFKDVQQSDSACVALAVALIREANRKGLSLCLANLSPAILELADLYSVSGFLAQEAKEAPGAPVGNQSRRIEPGNPRNS